MTVAELCTQLGWNIAELARQSKVDWRTAQRAWNKETISARAARNIAEAFSSAFSRDIRVGDIDGLIYR